MNRIPQLYGNPKVHKDCLTHVPFRPVNSQCGLLSAAASKYIDFYLKKAPSLCPRPHKEFIQSYLEIEKYQL